MFLVMGITGKVGGATARHLLAHGKKVRALIRNREKTSSWANQGVELVDGDWNDSAAIERSLKGVEGAFVMLPAVWAPSPDYKEAKGCPSRRERALETCLRSQPSQDHQEEPAVLANKVRASARPFPNAMATQAALRRETI